MSETRRDFLMKTGVGALAAMALPGSVDAAQVPATPAPVSVFGTAPPAGPDVGQEVFEAAGKLVRLEMIPAHRVEAASSWRASMAPLYERRTGPRRLALGYGDVPATVWNPQMTPLEQPVPATEGPFDVPQVDVRPLPAHEDEIAFGTVVELSAWLQRREITSERLTRIYLARLKRYDPQLRCVITLTEELALTQARGADAELAAGHSRGPLHGVPWGAKDLLDTAGIRTTWGAEPFRDRVPATDAAVVRMLREAGAVLVAKLSLGALALNDVWFGGQTRNPWLLEEGASGSSAGPGAAVAAGLVGFAIGSETQGSIVSPSMRCGVTGLRPTFGRVPRSGAMTLSWSCDKLGPMTRGVADSMLVLQAIQGFDASDAASVRKPLVFAGDQGVRGLRVGYFPHWMTEAPATEVDRHALEVVKGLGMETVALQLPDWPYDSLNMILFAEAAAAFEEITLDHQVDQMVMQTPDAWPNVFRQSRFLSAVDLVQADRLRRRVAVMFEALMAQVDMLLVPSLRDEFLVITNFTGHPSLTLRAGFVQVGEIRSDWAPDPAHPAQKLNGPRTVPYGVTLVGKLFEEGTIVRAGISMEHTFDVQKVRPAGF